MKNNIIYLLLIGVLLFSCANNKEDKQAKHSLAVDEKPPVIVPLFNGDSAYAYIQAQVDMGPRVPNSQAHKQAGDFLIATLQRFGASTEVQEFEAEAFDGTKLYLRNIIGSYNPSATKRILLAAHWDTRPFADKDTENKDMPIEGANDGGSGVAVLLELARHFQHKPPNVGIDIILFDGEDYGEPRGYQGQIDNSKIHWCLGSQYWSKNPHKKGYSAYYGILLDMVGAKNANFYREGYSMRYAPKIVEKVWKAAQQIGHGSFFIAGNTGMITDDHVFINEIAKIPTIDIIEYGPESVNKFFGEYHHTHQDNMSIISKATLQAVGETVMHVVYNE